MPNDRVPLRNPLFRLQFEKTQDCYVLLYPEGMVKLNPSAGEIMSRIDGINCINDIIQQLEAQFVQAGSLENDVLDFMQTARQKKWIYYE